MSCMVIEALTLRKICGVINALNYSGHAIQVASLSSFMERLKELTSCQFFDDSLIKSARIIHVLNHLAYRQRYREDSKYTAPSFDKPLSLHHVKPFDSFDTARPHVFQALKSLECLHYNCLDVSDELRKGKYKVCFDTMQELINILKTLIIENSPEYKAAKWG